MTEIKPQQSFASIVRSMLFSAPHLNRTTKALCFCALLVTTFHSWRCQAQESPVSDTADFRFFVDSFSKTVYFTPRSGRLVSTSPGSYRFGMQIYKSGANQVSASLTATLSLAQEIEDLNEQSKALRERLGLSPGAVDALSATSIRIFFAYRLAKGNVEVKPVELGPGVPPSLGAPLAVQVELRDLPTTDFWQMLNAEPPQLGFFALVSVRPTYQLPNQAGWEVEFDGAGENLEADGSSAWKNPSQLEASLRLSRHLKSLISMIPSGLEMKDYTVKIAENNQMAWHWEHKLKEFYRIDQSLTTFSLAQIVPIQITLPSICRELSSQIIDLDDGQPGCK